MEEQGHSEVRTQLPQSYHQTSLRRLLSAQLRPYLVFIHTFFHRAPLLIQDPIQGTRAGSALDSRAPLGWDHFSIALDDQDHPEVAAQCFVDIPQLGLI